MSGEDPGHEHEERLGRQLDDARAEVRLLTEQLAIAERVHRALRSRIASLERALEQRGTPLPPVDDDTAGFGRAGGDSSPSARPRADGAAEDYGFGEHDDDLLPEPDPDDRHGRWRRNH